MLVESQEHEAVDPSGFLIQRDRPGLLYQLFVLLSAAMRCFETHLLHKEQQALLAEWVAETRLGNTGTEDLTFELLFRASRDGFSADVFHQRCDSQGATVVLAQSAAGHLFGGYTDMPWAKGCEWKQCHEAFLFRLAPQASKHRIKQGQHGKKTGILCSFDHGATFGMEAAWWKHDMNLLRPHAEWQVKFNLGVAYDLAGLAKGWLAEGPVAAVTEVEVFAVRAPRTPRHRPPIPAAELRIGKDAELAAVASTTATMAASSPRISQTASWARTSPTEGSCFQNVVGS